MADHNNLRSYRAREPKYQQDAEEGRGDGDPLAELARLIGQTDPFAERERIRQRGEQPSGRGSAATQASERWRAQSAEPAPEDDHGGYGAEDYAHYDAAGAEPAEAFHAAESESGYEDDSGQADEYQHDGYGAGYEADYGADPQALEEAAYREELARKQRRNRLIAVVAIACLGVFGAAAAYGYRNYVGHHHSASAPPVIMADTGPTKVIPVAKASENGNKLSYDRVGEGDQSEKIVPREEKPVDIKAAAVTPPADVYTAPRQTNSAEPPPATIPVAGRPDAQTKALPTMSSTSVPNGSGVLLPSPRRVKTVTIRPDMSVVHYSQPVQESPAQTASRAPAQPRVSAPPSRSAAPAPATTSHATPARPSRHAMAPLSLSPDGDDPFAGQQRVSASRDAIALASTAPTAAIPTQSASGGYAVQISSQRSEADAKASLRALQAKYPGVLHGRQSYIRRADLGSKGVYYRTLIGPFASAEEAAKFCSSLKAAGGQCLIHRN